MTAPAVARSRPVRISLGLAWILFLAAMIVALRALGRGDLSTPPSGSLGAFRAWIDRRDTPAAAFTLLRLSALAVTWYLLVATMLGLVARLARSPRLIRLADLATLPVARRVLAAAAGLSVSASSATVLAFPLLAPTHVHQTVVTKPVPGPHDEGTATMLVIDQPPAPRPPAPAPAPPGAAPLPTWSVTPGDSFWAIATTVLREAWRRPPTDAELVPYWHALIEHNRGRLVDAANADLVYSGQLFELPTPPARPET